MIYNGKSSAGSLNGFLRSDFSVSIILGVELKIALRMIAHGADLRSGRADNDVATVSALPDLDLALGEDSAGFHIVKKGAIALLMMALNLTDHAEAGCQLREALCLGRLGKAVIHVRPLVVFTLGSRGKIFGRIADACQLLEPQLGMLLLVVRRFEEQRRDLLVAFLCVSKVI